MGGITFSSIKFTCLYPTEKGELEMKKKMCDVKIQFSFLHEETLYSSFFLVSDKTRLNFQETAQSGFKGHQTRFCPSLRKKSKVLSLSF